MNAKAHREFSEKSPFRQNIPWWTRNKSLIRRIKIESIWKQKAG